MSGPLVGTPARSLALATRRRTAAAPARLFARPVGLARKNERSLPTPADRRRGSGPTARRGTRHAPWLLHMREPVESAKPGEEVGFSTTWRGDDSLRPGARVEATDGPFGTLAERRVGQGPEHGYLGVQTSEGLVYVPERLVRETRGEVIYLSLPGADVRAQASAGTLPVREAPDHLPHEPR
jgi:hypothetical protein